MRLPNRFSGPVATTLYAGPVPSWLSWPHPGKTLYGNALCWPTGPGKPAEGDVFQFNDLNLSFTPQHGTMLAIEPAKTPHSTSVPYAENSNSQRIGSAISLQRTALNMAVNAHEDIKKQQAKIQGLQLQLVKAYTQLGLKKIGEAKRTPAAQQTKLKPAKRRKVLLRK